jgi:hypothetical protein
MIQSLHISGFKLFRDCKLPKLGRLNLFVGENNTGKSCLLEAIGLYGGRTPVTDILETASRRTTGKLRPWIREGTSEESSSLRHPVFDLFRWAGPRVKAPIVIEQIGDSSPYRVEVQSQQRIMDDQGVIRFVPVPYPIGLIAEDLEIVLPVYRGEKQVALVTRNSVRRYTVRQRDRILDAEKLVNDDAFAIAHLSAGGFSEEKASSLWDALVQSPSQELILDWLRMLDPSIDDLAYVGEDGAGRARTALLKVEGEGRIPLRSMGDGLTRLFHMGLAMVSAAQGILLIDEFENGLHWKVQEQLWNVLCKAALEFNVQIFATTHSRDCIEGFTNAGRALGRDDAMIYRLERKGDDVFAANLPLINVAAAMREDQEVR